MLTLVKEDNEIELVFYLGIQIGTDRNHLF